MLKVDLGELARRWRVPIDETLPAEHPLLAGADFRLVRPLELHLEAQQAAHDVVVLGRMVGEAEVACRRCLVSVRTRIDQDVTFVFREGVAPPDAEAEEIYPLTARAQSLDLSGAVREHLLLAVPAYVECREACRGLCPHCGVNLNETTCSCETVEADDRWAGLRKLASKND